MKVAGLSILSAIHDVAAAMMLLLLRSDCEKLSNVEKPENRRHSSHERS